MTGSLRRAAACAALAGAAAGIAYTALAITRVRAFRARGTPGTSATPAISLLRPLCGDEPRLYENLRSFCDQEYPDFQIIFGAAQADDPALAVALRVQREFPQRDISVVGGCAQPACNPKIGNLLGIADKAKHEIILIADSDIRVGRNYLRTIAACFDDERVGAVTCLYGAQPESTLISQLGAMHVNEHFAPSVLVANALEPLTYCFGATMAIRRHVLRQIGDLHALANHLGDDYRLGRLVADAGYRVRLAPYVVQTGAFDADLRSLWLHELRWARTIRAARPVGYAGSALTYALPLAMLFALLSGSPSYGAAVIALASALRVRLAIEASKTFTPTHSPALCLIPARDCLSAAVWGAAFFGGAVRWKEGQYEVATGGRMTEGPAPP